MEASNNVLISKMADVSEKVQIKQNMLLGISFAMSRVMTTTVSA